MLAQAEAFRGLGVEIKREINPDLAEQAVSGMKSIDFGRFGAAE